MIAGFGLFLVGFYAISPAAFIKGYITIIGLILSFYGFINILTWYTLCYFASALAGAFLLLFAKISVQGFHAKRLFIIL